MNSNEFTSYMKETQRENVFDEYKAAISRNKYMLLKGDDKSTIEYIFPNQKEDATNIVNIFYNNRDIIVVSITKRTKVGMDGLMIEIAKILTTHSDDDFILNYENIRFITGMSNRSWQEDFKDKVPRCFNNKIFHHGQLHNSNLKNLKNGLIIIDEIDSGDDEFSVLHNTLKEAGITDVNLLKQNNTRLIVVSATMLSQLKELFKWGNLHKNYHMTIPSNYISHKDFKDKNIIQEFILINSVKAAEDWIKTDILDKYKKEYRVHIIRLNLNNIIYIKLACEKNKITFKEHTSNERLTMDEENKIFKTVLTNHIVLGVKGFFRRANLIPNSWKLRIGAVHELYTEKVNINVQIQGLAGRMTGYWKDIIENGHITGPIRTSIKAIDDYEKIIQDPLNNKIKLNFVDKTFLNPSNWDDIPIIDHERKKFDKKLKGYQLILIGNITDIQIEKWCKDNNLPVFNCINTIEILDKNIFIEKYGKYEINITFNKINNSDLESYEKLKSYINLNFNNVTEPTKGWLDERLKRKKENMWLDRITRTWSKNHINDYNNTKNFILDKQMHLWSIGYDNDENLNICLRHTTTNKLLPTKSSDYIKHNPYIINDNMITYSKIKSDVDIDKLPDDYYWKSLDGYLYLYKKDHSESIFFSNIELNDQDHVEEININTTKN